MPRSAIPHPTARGWTFIAFGAILVMYGFIEDQRDIVRVGLAGLAVVVTALLAVSVTRPSIHVSRVVEPPIAQRGDDISVLLTLRAGPYLPGGALLAEDCIHQELGESAKFRIGGQSSANVRYHIATRRRGRWILGPLKLTVTDPFLLAERVNLIGRGTEVVVGPAVHDLEPPAGAGQWRGFGDSSGLGVAASGADDVAVREYHQGDDIRRIHWKSSARQQELMVRREEHPEQLRASIVLDTRKTTHSADSLEWAIDAAVSIAHVLSTHGFTIQISHNDNPPSWLTPNDTHGFDDLIVDLAQIELSSHNSFGYAIEQTAHASTSSLHVVLVAQPSTDDIQAITSLHHTGSGHAIVLALDPTASGQPHRMDNAADIKARRRSHNTHAIQEALDELNENAWNATAVDVHETVAQAWERARHLEGQPFTQGAFS